MKLSTLVMIGSEFQGILMKKEEEKQELLLKEKQQEKIRIRIDEKKQEKWEEIAFYILELPKALIMDNHGLDAPQKEHKVI